MKKLQIIILCLLLSSTAFSQEKLDNQSIVDLVEMGFSGDVISSKINSSDVSFDVSVGALKKLKNKGVPSEVLALMIEKSKSETKTKGGLYYKNNDKLVKIEPTVFAGTRSNALASSLSYGIAAAKVKSYIPNMSSANKLKATDASFIFKFDENTESSLEKSNWWFRMASSPNEFVLTKLKVRKSKKERELVTGKVRAITGASQMGIDSKNTIPFKFERLSEGVYKVTPEQSLTPGEYCFFYQGQIPEGGFSNQSVFDFTIE